LPSGEEYDGKALQLTREQFPAAVALLLSRQSASGDGSAEDDAACTQYSCLALLAHLLNERVVAQMQTAARAHLRNDEWGAQLSELKPIDAPEVCQEEFRREEWRAACGSLQPPVLQDR
jgi:hypothetical protein